MRVRAWLELALPLALALLAWLATPGAQRRHEAVGGAPWPVAPEQLTVQGPKGAYRLLLAHRPPLLCRADGTALARLDRREAQDLRRELTQTRVLRHLDRATLDQRALQDLGWERRLQVDDGRRAIELAGIGSDRGYLFSADAVLVLDRDPAALLDRHHEALRSIAMDLPDQLRSVQGGDWKLEVTAGRWWLQRDARREWTDSATIANWLQTLALARPVSFGAPEQVIVRAELVFTGLDDDGRQREVRLADLGPARNGGRHLRRSERFAEHSVVEDLVVDLDGVVFDPDPQSFASRLLLPIDPQQADRVIFGRLTLTRHQGVWRIGGSDDVDQTQVRALLGRLAVLEATPEEDRLPGPAGIVVEQAGTRFEPPCRDRRLVDLLEQLEAWHLSDRHLFPGIAAREVIGVIFTPADGAPQVYDRQGDAAWDPAIAAELTPFIETLLAATVERWTATWQAGDPPPFVADSNITIATAQRHISVRIDQQGQVLIPERGIVGQLDAASRRRLMDP